jgi:hypothetical protein
MPTGETYWQPKMDFIVTACNSHEAHVESNRIAGEGINTILDNWKHWTDEQKQVHLIHLQQALSKAGAK